MGRDRGRGRGGKSEAAAARERVRALEERLRQLQQTQQTMQQQQQQQAPQTPYYPAYTPHPPSYGPQQPVNNYYFGAGGMTQPQAPYVPPPSAFAPVQAPNPAFSALPAPNQLPAQYAQPQQGFVGSTYSFNFPPQVHAQQAYPAYAQTPSPLAYCQQQAPAVPATQQALPGPPSSASTKKGGKGKSANTDLLAPVNASAKIGKKVGSKKLTEREKMQKFGAAYKTPEQLAELKKAKKVRSQTQEDEQQNQQQSQQSTLPAPTFFHVDIAALFDRHFGSAETGTPEVTETSREPPLGIGFVTPTEVDDDDEEEKRERRRKRFGDSQ